MSDIDESLSPEEHIERAMLHIRAAADEYYELGAVGDGDAARLRTLERKLDLFEEDYH